MNKVFLIGRLVKDPEIRYSSNSTPVATFTLAINRPKRSDGEQEADFINIVVWNKLAENCSKYLMKGSQVAIDGRIQVRNYDDDNGKRHYVTEIVAENVQFLGSKKSEASLPEEQDYLKAKNDITDPYAEMAKQVSMDDYSVDSEDLPF